MQKNNSGWKKISTIYPSISPKFDLSNLFSLDGVLSSSNNSHMPDSVSARILVTNNSNPEIAIAGASLGARLGFETSALTFPLTIDDSNLFEKNSFSTIFLLG